MLFSSDRITKNLVFWGTWASRIIWGLGENWKKDIKNGHFPSLLVPSMQPDLNSQRTRELLTERPLGACAPTSDQCWILTWRVKTLILHTLLEEWDSPSHSQDQSIYGAFSIRGKFLFILNYNFNYFSNFHPFPGSNAGLTYHSFQNSLLRVSKGNAYYVSFCYSCPYMWFFTLVKHNSFPLTSLS